MRKSPDDRMRITFALLWDANVMRLEGNDG
jgi:hypothetical protein